VILSIKITDGRSICDYSPFQDEAEILLSPNMAFVVSGEKQERDGFSFIEIVQVASNENTFVF